MQWFSVDKVGLGKILARKGKPFAIFELIQNTWDERTSNVNASLTRMAGTKYAKLIVEDDNPEGFADLSHAFTLFAESAKKTDPTKRGRFNLGEKLVLALCEEAEIASTTGTIVFDKEGRHQKRSKRECGSMFTGVLRMTNEEIEDCNRAVRRLIPPSNITTRYNGVVLPSRTPIATVETTLATEIANDEGLLTKTTRKTIVEIYDPLEGEVGGIYELGIPVVDTEDRYHANVLQKVPLTFDRENVTPAYLSQIRAIVLETVKERLTNEDANSVWVRQALEDHGDELAPETVHRVVDLRFGEKRVAYDPSDPEANSLAVSMGYTVVHGGTMSKAEWDAVKRTGAMLPAGQVTPSPKPFSPGGKTLNVLSFDKWTPEMKVFSKYLELIAPKLIGGKKVCVTIASEITWPYNATFCRDTGEMIFNVGRLGKAWFLATNRREQNRLMIHELGHEYSGDHLSSAYHDALCNIGAKLAELALTDPGMFK